MSTSKELKELPCISKFLTCGYVLPLGGMYACRECGHKDLHDEFSQPKHYEYKNYLAWKESSYADFSDFLVYEKGWAKVTNSMVFGDRVLFCNELTGSQRVILFQSRINLKDVLE